MATQGERERLLRAGRFERGHQETTATKPLESAVNSCFYKSSFGNLKRVRILSIANQWLFENGRTNDK